MKKTFLAAAAALLSLVCMAENKPKVEVHGFIRNYFALDTREGVDLTEDFFTYLPYDHSYGDNGVDLNKTTSFRFAALTSRLWVEAKGYEFNGIKMGARIEGDFYSGVSNVTGTATLRLRQAFVTLSKDAWAFKIGQAWHPMAADMPDVFSLNTGAPFGPFSRTPQVDFNYKLGNGFSISADAIWQMQYCSNGPEGTSANYIKYGCTPELYLGVNYTSAKLLTRLGLDMLSIKPRRNNGSVKVSDRITTISPFFYLQYKEKDFSVKFKTIFAQAGEHVNLNGGYGVTSVNNDGSYTYTPTRNWSSWLSLSYGHKVQGVLFGGFVHNFGTAKALYDGDGDGLADAFYFSKNSFSNMNNMFRITPAVIWNLGKLALGLEYEVTAVQYGEYKTSGLVDASNGLVKDNLHWLANNRVQAMVKFTF